MATAGLKLDDGSGGFATNCFPVRTLFRQSDEAAGAWLVAHRAEQRRRFKAVLCTRPRTFSQIREERRKADKGSGFTSPTRITETQATAPDNDGPVLDGFFLLRHCCVEDPSHLCSVNIAGQELSEVKEDDLEMFDNVAYVNAAENYLPFEAFHHFPIIRELEMPLNGLRGLKMQHGLFPHLEMLDLSFNNLSEADVLSLGMLPNLKVLQLSGNGFRGLPEDMALPYRNGAGQFNRFPRLEILMLDDNKFSDVAVFACLAGLRCLRQLNLEKNDIFFVPQLLVTDGRVKTRDENFISHKHKKSDAVRHAQEAKLMDLLEQRLLNTPRPGTEQGEPLVENPETEKNTAENTISGPSQSNEQLTSISKSDEDLLTDDFSTAELSARISDLNLVEVTDGYGVVDVSSSVTVHDASLGPPPPPFSELRLLNLAHNQICSEEALLAVAAWPMLVELIIHDNPLTDEHTGDPPLLKRFLGDRLGINLVRKKPQPPGKKTVEISTKKSRKVKTTVPKIPKVSVEERLMLEAPESLRENRAHSSAERHRVLPPIASDSQTRASSAQDSKGQRSEEVRSKVTVTIPTTSEAWTGDDLTDDATDNPFFMTQVDESDGTKQEVSVAPTERELQVQELMRDERYKGYEDLLDIDPALDFVPPKDISGNIRALKYALGHELVFRDPVAQLDVVKRPARQYRRSEMNRKPAKTRQQRVDEMLKNLKQRTTVEEAELREVLRDKKKLGKKFPEAETLLEEIQHRYNAVRVTSMSEANTSRNLVRETLTSVQEVTGSTSSESVREQQGVA